MKLTVTKDVFLSNTSNEQCFIQLLGQRLSARGSKVLHERSDADALIVKTALESAAILVRDDTDLLILLIHHAPLDNHEIFFTSECKNYNKNGVWDIKEVKTGLGTLRASTCFFFMLSLAVTPPLASMESARDPF